MWGDAQYSGLLEGVNTVDFLTSSRIKSSAGVLVRCLLDISTLTWSFFGVDFLK